MKPEFEAHGSDYPTFAVENAVSSAKRELIHDHIENCLDEPKSALSDKAALKELKAITKYL